MYAAASDCLDYNSEHKHTTYRLRSVAVGFFTCNRSITKFGEYLHWSFFTNLELRFCFMPYFLRTGQTAELAYSALKLKNY